MIQKDESVKDRTPEEKAMRRKKRKRLFSIIAAVLLSVLIIFSFLPQGQSFWSFAFHAAGLEKIGAVSQNAPLSIHFIDVGKADAILVVCEGKTLLLDAGTFDKGEFVSDYLTDCKIGRLDYALFSHTDADHTGGMAKVLSEHGANEICAASLQESFFAGSREISEIKAQAESQEIPWRFLSAGDSFLLGEAEVKVLAPLRFYSSSNDSSLVIKLTYHGFSALFCGDMEKEAESELVDSQAELEADLLKVSHHGSKTSTAKKFLKSVNPRYAVISVGVDRNRLPSQQVLRRLENFEAEIYRTDTDGTVVFTYDKQMVSVFTENEAPWERKDKNETAGY